MTKQRVDNWTTNDDKILADTVLNYVRYGRTQLEAFEDAGEVLDRSAGACAYRWNKELRKSYREELRLARRERRHQKLDVPPKEYLIEQALKGLKPIATNNGPERN